MAALSALRCRISHPRIELSNSGEALKILVPNINRKIEGGWSNYSGMVTSQYMKETEMGNRGSKSTNYNYNSASLVNSVVKEQRVDGSWHFKCLRCTLMGFERNYQIKVLSNQKRFYTNLNSNQLNPWFVTGFTYAESTFNILVQPRSDSVTKWRVKAIFAITLHKKDIEILEKIKTFFSVGHIYSSGTKIFYRVESFKELQVIMDYFYKYPLVTTKKLDYALLKKSFNLINTKEHLTEQGLANIIKFKSILNRGLYEKLKNKFNNINSLEKEKFIFEGIPNPYWVSGFVSGDGSFNIKTTKTRKGKVQLRFAVHLHIKEKEVIKGLAKFFNFEDNKFIYYTNKTVTIQIVSFLDNLNIIIPYFDKYQIKGTKELDFIDFKKVALIVKLKDHLTEVGFNKILAIKDNMNLNRK